MLWRVQKAGFTIAETPIVFTDRRRGASKISQKEIFHAAGTVFRLTFSRNTTPAIKLAPRQSDQ
jgi:predicted acetyltransferase